MKYPYRRRLSITIPLKLHNQIRMLAKKKNCTITDLIKMITVREIVKELFIENDKC